MRQFLRDNPNNPHRSEAESLVQQYDERLKQDAAKQEMLKQQNERTAKEQLLRQQVAGTLVSLNGAFQSHNAQSVKRIWPKVSQAFLESMRNDKISFNAPEVEFPAADQAIVRCDLVTSNPQRRPPTETHKFTFTLRLNGSTWVIDEAHAN